VIYLPLLLTPLQKNPDVRKTTKSYTKKKIEKKSIERGDRFHFALIMNSYLLFELFFGLILL